MYVPDVRPSDSLNNLSVEINWLEKKINKKLCMVNFIDDEMRHTAQLVAEVAEVKLEVLRPLLAQPHDQRNYAQITSALRDASESLLDDSIANFQGLIGARKYRMKDGKKEQITSEIRAEMEATYAQWLRSEVEKRISDVDVQDDASLRATLNHLEEESSKSKKLFAQLLDSKTPHIDKIYKWEKDTIDLLKEKNKALAKTVTDIFSACQEGALEYLAKEIESYWFSWTLQSYLNEQDDDGFFPIDYAAYYNHPRIVRKLIEVGANPAPVDNEGYTPLHWAAKAGALDVVQQLLEQSAVDVNAKGAYGRTALHMAAFNGRPQVAQFLLQKGANINAQTTLEDHCKTPMHEVVIHADIAFALQLLENQKLDVMVKDSSGYTVLYHAVCDGLASLIVPIISHPSWKVHANAHDPNHPTALLSLEPRQNGEEVKRILSNIPID